AKGRRMNRANTILSVDPSFDAGRIGPQCDDVLALEPGDARTVGPRLSAIPQFAVRLKQIQPPRAKEHDISRPDGHALPSRTRLADPDPESALQGNATGLPR